MNISRIFIILGIVFLAIGVFWQFGQKLGLGRLPGDIVIDRGNFKFYFPIATSIILSVILTLLFWLFRK